jgi:hypothetical protein
MAFTQIEAAGITSTSTVVLQNATVAGVLTATSGFVGNLTGNVTGSMIGNVTGNVTGNLVPSSGVTINSPASNTLAFVTNNIEAGRFDGNGRLGIGTQIPSAVINLRSSAAELARFTNTGSNGGDWEIKLGGGGFEDRKFMLTDRFGGTDNVRVSVDSSGNLLINRTTPFTPSGMSGSNVQSSSGFSVTNGSSAAVFQLDRINFNSSNYYVLNASSVGVNLVNGATSWAAQSDERFKTDLVPIDNGLEKISTLRAVTGRYTSDDESVSRSFLIAQDVQKVLPEAVSESDDEDKTLTLRYQEVIPLLVSALKESKERIEALEEEVQTLKSRINN